MVHQQHNKQVRNKIPPKTKPKPVKGVSIADKDPTKDKKDSKPDNKPSNASANNPENKNEMSLEIKSQQSSNDEDPGYASVEEIPLDSPGRKHLLFIYLMFYYSLWFFMFRLTMGSNVQEQIQKTAHAC